MTSNTESPLRRLGPVAHRQLGLFTAPQARDAGWQRSHLDRRLRSGELVAVDENVFRSATTPPMWRQRLLAACLAGPAVASHRSAGALWQLPDLAEDTVEVTALRHRRRKSPDVVWHESYFLDSRDITEIESVPVTNATRTILDLAAVLEPDGLLRVLDDVLRRRLSSIERIGQALERMGPRRPGVRQIEQCLAHRSGSAFPESVLETMFEEVLRAHDLPRPTPQFLVTGGNGRRFRIDFAYERYKLGVELLGAQFHANPGSWDADVARLTALNTAGWDIRLFTYRQVRDQPTVVAQAVRTALVLAGHIF